MIQLLTADETHATTIRDFQVAMAQETENLSLDPETVLNGVRSLLAHPDRGHYVLAKNEGEIIASTLVLSEWSDWRNGEVWWIHSVYVTPPYRGKGAFKAIYESLKNQAKAHPSIFGIRLYVDKRNQIAKQIYKSIGMNNEHYELFEWLK